MRGPLVVVILACACHGKSDEVPCATVATRLFTIARDDLAKATVDPATRRAVSGQLPAIRGSLAQACTASAWSAQVRRCMVNAQGHVAFVACQQQLTDEQRRALDRAARGDVVNSSD